MYVEEKNMSEWKLICKEWCKKNNAKLLFVNSESFGCEMPDGQLKHIYIEELIDILGLKDYM